MLKFGLAKEDHWWWCLAARLVRQPAAMAAFKGLVCSGGCLGATSPIVMSASLPITPWCCRAGFFLLPLPSRTGRASPELCCWEGQPPASQVLAWHQEGADLRDVWARGFRLSQVLENKRKRVVGFLALWFFFLNQRRRWLPRK